MLSQTYAALLLTWVSGADFLLRDAVRSGTRTRGDPAVAYSSPRHDLCVDHCLLDPESTTPLALLQAKPAKRMRAVRAAEENGSAALLRQTTATLANLSHPGQPMVNRTLESKPLRAWPPQALPEAGSGEQGTVAALQVTTMMTAATGDMVQGLVFATVCLIIVLGIYLLVFADCWPSGGNDRASKKQQHSRAASWAGSMSEHPSPIQKALESIPQSPSLPGRRTLGGLEFGEEEVELPMIYPPLVTPVAYTRLAVPVEPLSQPLFKVDVLRLSGVPFLRAALTESAGARDIRISLYRDGTLIAIISPALEVRRADGGYFGKIVQDPQATDAMTYVFQDARGKAVFALVGMQKESRDFKMTSVSGSGVVEHASAVWRPQGKLPAEHYEIVVSPNVDAVLVLSCLLAMTVFNPGKEDYSSIARLAEARRGRPSTVG